MGRFHFHDSAQKIGCRLSGLTCPDKHFSGHLCPDKLRTFGFGVVRENLRMKWSQLHKTKHDGAEDSDEESSDEEADEDAALDFRMVPATAFAQSFSHRVLVTQRMAQKKGHRERPTPKAECGRRFATHWGV